MADDLSDDLEEAVSAIERVDEQIKRLDEILGIVEETWRLQAEADKPNTAKDFLEELIEDAKEEESSTPEK